MYQGKPIREMTVTQLEAAIIDLREQGFVSHATVKFYMTCDEPEGDGAQMAFDQEFQNVVESTPNSDLDRLEAELDRRLDIWDDV